MILLQLQTNSISKEHLCPRGNAHTISIQQSQQNQFQLPNYRLASRSDQHQANGNCLILSNVFSSPANDLIFDILNVSTFICSSAILPGRFRCAVKQTGKQTNRSISSVVVFESRDMAREDAWDWMG